MRFSGVEGALDAHKGQDVGRAVGSMVVYYFSSTGNSLAVANRLVGRLGAPEPVSMPGTFLLDDPYEAAEGADKVGFVFPVHRATIPEMVRGFIEQMPVRPDCYYFAVSTYTLFSWNEFWEIDEILLAKGARLNYAEGVRMMGNVGLTNPSERSVQRRMREADDHIGMIAEAVANSQENIFRPALKPLAHLVKRFSDSRRKHIVFHIDKHCKRCGICTQVCPVQNISLDGDDFAPVRSDKCMACLACIRWCPANAVGTLTKLHGHYHHPDISPDQLNPAPRVKAS
jgi:ferredoxin